jgi:hypothetical protein
MFDRAEEGLPAGRLLSSGCRDERARHSDRVYVESQDVRHTLLQDKAATDRDQNLVRIGRMPPLERISDKFPHNLLAQPPGQLQGRCDAPPGHQQFLLSH